jgi:threonyl-tRNA synthetase
VGRQGFLLVKEFIYYFQVMSGNVADFKNILPDFVKTDADLEMYKLRHSTEHVFAQAVTELFPGKVKLAVAHISADTFANDAKWEVEINEERFAEIEQKMQEIIDRNLPFVRKEVTVEEARELLKGNEFKLEWLEQFASEDKTITMYWTGDEYVDLCKGPHLNSTGEIKAFKLLNVAGAYWRGDEKNAMLTRVYGTAFGSKEELAHYLEMQEEAKRRDHRKLSKELDLIVFSELVGTGLPMYTPRGSILRNAVYNYSRELNRRIGYAEVNTPNINRAELFKISGHYDKYKDDMLRVTSQYSEEEMFFKPMNCPQHTQIYASRMRSYRDLPFRVADFSNLGRDERPGEIHGILRSRIFTQDDGHAFVREDQIADEFKNVLGVITEALKTYGLNYWIRLSLWDPEKKEKYLGDEQTWEKSQRMLKEMLADMKVEYREAVGEAAIYGPKMDFMAVDSLGREWQISTIQIDMNMPGRFGLKYVDQDGSEKTPIMIHRAIVGSERFIGIIIEHFGGAFPAWMAPEQVRIIPIKDEHIAYANKLRDQLYSSGVQVTIDGDAERMQNKIRKAQEMKVPYMLIVGGQEETDETVSVRLRTGEEIKGMKFTEFQEKLSVNIRSRKLELAL